jgi:hypothetical protein
MAPREVGHPPDCPATGKRAYRSKRAALRAHRQASYRLRIYACTACGHWHTSNTEKNR